MAAVEPAVLPDPVPNLEPEPTSVVPPAQPVQPPQRQPPQRQPPQQQSPQRQQPVETAPQAEPVTNQPPQTAPSPQQQAPQTAQPADQTDLLGVQAESGHRARIPQPVANSAALPEPEGAPVEAVAGNTRLLALAAVLVLLVIAVVVVALALR